MMFGASSLQYEQKVVYSSALVSASSQEDL